MRKDASASSGGPLPVSRTTQAVLSCPQCGHEQNVAKTAFSAVCRKCGMYLRVQDLLKPAKKVAEATPDLRQISCFGCGTSLEVPASAQSTMCKRCSCYIDLHDYDISSAVSKNFKTKGSFVIQPSGYVFNTEAIVREAVIKGRFLGKLIVEDSLTVFSTAEIRGTFAADRLIVPAANTFRWKDTIHVGSLEVSGELIADVKVRRMIVVRPQGRLFGSVEAKSIVVELGGVLVGAVRISNVEPTK